MGDATEGDDNRGADDAHETSASDMEEAQPEAGGLDLSAVLQSALKMGEQIRQASVRAAETEVEGRAAGGLVRVRVTGDLQFRSVEISDEAFSQGDREMLEDLVLAAVRDAVARANEIQRRTMGGIDLEGILGSFGGPAGRVSDGVGLPGSFDPSGGSEPFDTPHRTSGDEVG
ncbi:MAG: hypothetical protein KatS3mg008_1269 [Acidimicrobiales bacterium]|nr:MAG: hypothetical protein KatS3mg008_1269 [Acidimicrobiales bacterium]